MASSNNTSRLVELAGIISSAVDKIQGALSEKGLPQPSFDEDSNYVLPAEAHVVEAQGQVLDAAGELYDLLLDPFTLLFRHGGVGDALFPMLNDLNGHLHNNMVCQQAITRFRMADQVPPGGQRSFADIAKSIKVDEQSVTRLLRYAMTMRIFCEPTPGMVAHTNISKLLRTPHVHDWMTVATEEIWPASTKASMLDAMQKWPGSQEPNETGFTISNNTTVSIYDTMAANPQRAERFGGAMVAFASSPSVDIAHLVNYYNWASLGDAAQVVDIGGGTGAVAKQLAEQYSGLHVLVQDIAPVVDDAKANVPAYLKERVRFMTHDMFAPQTITADVYVLRWVLHNWADKYAIMILRALVPALRCGVKILLNEMCMPDPGAVALSREKDLRAMDLDMAAVFNSHERSAGQWRSLLAEADPRFELRNVIQPPGSILAIIEVGWNVTSSLSYEL
ncbi:O-methyltransferase 7 [Talaromyces islandicus]|uniref:O-methyltransferase 7 n=1 Tax=Talaromyces islandicus TaxID=28573 RepID=A0A0U1LLU4_TALIS|nr:O-methyltransferase 7 [Talaromyces islandicus]